MILRIYIENQLLDLFDDENIELNSSVANTEDISKVNTDYTRTFTVPASDNNNKLFKHYYNADIDNTFDARVKKNARIEFEGMPFRTGKMRLEKVAVKNGRPSAYTINFWGNLVNLKTLLKDDLLNILDLSAYDHNYNYSAVASGLTAGLFDRDIIYTLLSQRRQFMYSSDPSDDTNTDKLVNIAYNGENRGIIWSDLKPSIRLLCLIEAIEAKYGITFSRDFFGRHEFKEQYIWLNNTEGANYTEQLIDWTSGSATDFGLNLTTNQWVVTAPYSGALELVKYRLEITPQPGYETIPYKIIVKKGTDVFTTIDATGHFTTEFLTPPDPPFVITFHVSAAATFEYEADLLMRAIFTFGHTDRAAHANANIITDKFDVALSLPKLKTIDFLKGLFNAFKLVAIPDNLGNVYVNNIDDYYSEGTIHDITKWVDSEKYDVERGKIFQTINFAFQEPTTLLNMQFKTNTGAAYGDELLQLADEDGVPLDGEELEITLPFEQVVYERLTDINANGYTNIQYGLILDDKLEPANPKALIFYNNRISVEGSPISLMDQAGETNEVRSVINTPGHSLGFDNPQFSLLWGVEFSTWNGSAITNTLYLNYWNSYISSIFNIKKRNFKFKAILPTWLLTKMALNDILFIKERYYRINDFTVNLTTRETTLNLMNTFETRFNEFAPSQSRVFLTSIPQTYGVYVTNGATMNIAKEDTGYGTGWATVTQDGYNINITVTDNAGPDARIMLINVDNGAGKSFQIFLNQAAQ